MNIQSSQISKISGVVIPANRQISLDDIPETSSPEALQVSGRAREVAAGVEALKRVAEVREDKVAEAAARLADPAKALSTEALVEALLASGSGESR